MLKNIVGWLLCFMGICIAILGIIGGLMMGSWVLLISLVVTGIICAAIGQKFVSKR